MHFFSHVSGISTHNSSELGLGLLLIHSFLVGPYNFDFLHDGKTL